jgi:hypothetical protein
MTAALRLAAAALWALAMAWTVHSVALVLSLPVQEVPW